jgi:tagatose-1,6-bisphosphate aldolase
MADFWVNGIVSNRDQQPYVQLSNEKGMIAQLSMSQARQIAMDMLVMASRTECDAMVVKFFSKLELPPQAASAMLVEFRDFRAELDDENIQHTHRGELPPG